MCTRKCLNKLTEELAVTLLNKYLTGKANVFYVEYVAEMVECAVRAEEGMIEANLMRQ